MEYNTEEEQLEKLKKLWSSYGSHIFYGALIIFAAVYGFKSWQDRQEAKLEKSSNLYTRAFVAFSDGNDEEFRAISNQLLSDYPGSVYADFLRLLLAKEAVKNKNNNEAEKYLLQVINKTKQDSLGKIARFRLARIYLSQGKQQLVNAQADVLKETDFDFFAHELYGDINLLNKKYEQADKEYKIALEKQNKKFPGTGSILRNKLQFLSKEIPNKN
jgi:predicted negative regulator of RcsB-dependent stress response